MESESCGGVTLDISFGYDDPNFSDRTLLLEIIADADSKRRRSHDLLGNASPDTNLSPPPRVKTIHIASLILAARSPFFRKLFSNGMQESEQKHVTLQIEALEEVCFMNLLKYVYSNNLPDTFDALADLLVMADKYEVDSCLRDCTQSLQNLPMTCESASVYLDLSSSLVTSLAIQPLIDAAKQFLVAHYKELDKQRCEMLNLPLTSIEAVLSSNDLVVSSEYVVFDLVVRWASIHYPNLKERRQILKTHLLHLVRFPFMTTTKLIKQVQTCEDIDPELASKIVIRALSFKAESGSHQKQCLAVEEDSVASRQFVERAYIYRPVKVVELELPHPQCVVYLDLTRNELKRISSERSIWSKTFHLDGRKFRLCARRSDQLILDGRKFRLCDQLTFCLCLVKPNSSSCTVKYEFAIRMKPHESFQNRFTGSHTFTKYLRIHHGFDWTDFIGDNSSYFINDILHIRAELTIL